MELKLLIKLIKLKKVVLFLIQKKYALLTTGNFLEIQPRIFD